MKNIFKPKYKYILGSSYRTPQYFRRALPLNGVDREFGKRESICMGWERGKLDYKLVKPLGD